MPHSSSPTVVVIHGVGVKGVAGTDALARATGLAPDEVEVVLADLARVGLVEHRRSHPAGWALTRSGRRREAELVADELDASGARQSVHAAYRRFLDINPALLAVCTDWQLRPSTDGGPRVANDHLDAGYDRSVVQGLSALHQRALPVLADLESALARFAPYRVRLGGALARVQAGEGEWLTGPLRDSYHTVWFELHQDLLDTLGIERASVGRGAA